MQTSEDLFVEYKKCLERYSNCFCWLHQAVNEVEAIDQWDDINDDWIFGKRKL